MKMMRKISPGKGFGLRMVKKTFVTGLALAARRARLEGVSLTHVGRFPSGASAFPGRRGVKKMIGEA